MVHLLPDKVIDIPAQDFFSFIFAEMPKEQLDTTAFIDGLTNDSITYGQLQSDCLAFARGLRDPASPWGGLKKHDVVCIFGANSLQTPMLIYGLFAAGCAMTPSNPMYLARELAHQLRSSGSKMLVAHSSMLKTAEEAMAEVGLPKSNIILMDSAQSGSSSGTKYVSLTDILERGRQLTDDQVGGPVKFTEHDIKGVPALLPYSSGTTGPPKGVMLSHFNLVANVVQFLHQEGTTTRFNPSAREVRPCFIPLFHMAGCFHYLCVAPFVGATVAVFPRFDPQLALETWAKYKTKYLIVVPPIANMLAKTDLSKYDLSNVSRIICGGAPLGPEVEAAIFETFKIPIRQAFGATETTCNALNNTWDSYEPGSVGMPLPNTEVKVVDPTSGEPVGFGKEGELWIKGPQVAVLGYQNNPEATRNAFTSDGWLKTGDLVACNENRMFWIKDRLKELIKVNAFQVAPAELEDLLMKHNDIADACVIGIPDDSTGEVPRAYVVLKPGIAKSDAKADEIKKFVDGMVTSYKRLKGGIEFRDGLPRTPSGKLMRRELREEVKQKLASARL